MNHRNLTPSHLLTLFCCTFALLLSGCASKSASLSTPSVSGVKLISSPSESDLLGVYHYQLENGLDIYLMKNDQEPRFYSEIAVRTGSRNDPPETTGLAHYLEHLLFKGTTELGTIDYAAEKPHLDRIEELYEEHFREQDPERMKAIYEQIDAEAQLAAQYAVPNELQSVYKALGGSDLNAHTWRDETVYKVGLPANRMEQWAAIEAERFRDPVFRLFHTELQTVYEEKNRALDNKDRIIFDAINESLYQVHPYGQQTTLGDADHLRRPSIKTIREYYNTYYVPNNMAIVISGDIDLAETVTLIRDHFGYMKPQEIPEPPVWDEPALTEVRRTEVFYPGEEQVMIGFRTAAASSEDRIPLQILDMILDNRTAGLINLNLNQSQKVRSAGAYPLIDNDYGSQFLYGSPKEGQTLEEVEQLLLDQIELIRSGDFDAEILPAIVNDFRKSEQLSIENNTSRVAKVRDAYLAYRPWTEAQNDLARYAEVTKDDIVRVANQYFNGGYVVTYRRDGEYDYDAIEPPEITNIEMQPGLESEFAAQILGMDVQPIEPQFVEIGKDVVKKEMGSNSSLYYAKNPMNDLFTLTLIVNVGDNHDSRLGMLSRLLDKSGIEITEKGKEMTLSSEDLKKKWYSLGTDFSFSSSDNQTQMTISGLNDQFEESLDLMMTFLAHPAPEEGALAEMKQIILKQRQDDLKDPARVSRAASWYSRYGEKSPMRESLSDSQLNALTEDQLISVLEMVQNTVYDVAYVGPRTIEDIKPILNKHLPAADELRPAPVKRIRESLDVSESEIMFVELDTVQTQLRLEHTGSDWSQDRVVPAMIFTNYFGGGMSGLVFQEIREARALAYSSGAAYVMGGDQEEKDLMIGVVGTQAEKTNEALNQMLRLLNEMPEEEGRFENAKQFAEESMRTNRIGFRGVIGSLMNWEDLGLTENPNPTYFEQLQNITYEDMLEFYRSEVQNKPWRITLVGNRERIGKLDFEEKSTFKTVPVEDIFPKN